MKVVNPFYLLGMLLLSFCLGDFNPETIKMGQYKSYVNDPVLYNRKGVLTDLTPTLSINIDVSQHLLHLAQPVGHDVVVGLALYPHFTDGFKRTAGALRYFGYDGHIIFGVRKNIEKSEFNYLRKLNVTMYGVEPTECDSIAIGSNDSSVVRGKCSSDIKDLKLEWGRFEMARRWILVCETCTGWILLFDTRDTFFQGHPVSGICVYDDIDDMANL